MVHLNRETISCHVAHLAGYRAHQQNSPDKGNNHISHHGVGMRLDPKAMEWHGTDAYTGQVGKNGSCHGQDPHLTLVCLPTVQVQCSQVQACTRVGNELSLTLYKELQSVLWSCSSGEAQRQTDLLHADCPGGRYDSSSQPAIMRIKLGLRPFTPKLSTAVIWSH